MEQGLLLPRGAAPIRFRRLLLLWLYQQSFLRGWQSDIVLQPDEERPSFPAVLGAAQASSLLLLCLRPEDYQLLRCCNRELYGVFETIAALVRRAGPTEIEDHSEPELDVPSGIPSSVPGDAVSEGRWWDQVRDSECEEGPVVDPLESSSIDFASTFRSAVQSQFSLEDRNPLKLPWQMGVFGEIFGSSELELFPSLKRTIPTPLASDEGSHSEAAPAAVKRMRDQRAAQFDIGVDLWLTLIKGWGPCNFVDMLEAELQGDSQREVVSDVLRGKAPSTLLKRARAISGLQAFLAERMISFPCGEKDLYTFLKHMEAEGMAKSRCTGLLEALAFVRHVIGVEEVEELLKSRRCRGVGVVEAFKASKQAPALAVEQLLYLHDVLESHLDPSTRHFAGCALVATYSRCRWSDIQHADELILDRGSDGRLAYLELRIGVHKTCRLQSKRQRFLHVVSPSLGVKEFGELWLASRRDIGLDDVGRMPFCPAPDASASPTVRGIDSEEATSWLRLLLRDKASPGPEPSSKSFKATVLSWAAKRGVDGLSIQRLGYHAAGGLDIVYSRDAQAPYILIVEKLLAEVREGKFRPDDTRGGRLTGPPRPLVEPLIRAPVSRGVPDLGDDAWRSWLAALWSSLRVMVQMIPLPKLWTWRAVTARMVRLLEVRPRRPTKITTSQWQPWREASLSQRALICGCMLR
ncbi:unnamed protein product [Symbiodinium sp. KB8]|nr:unnamed protein product [Symbiodinium sp. KB8]